MRGASAHARWMELALRAAAAAPLRTSPNPTVGCVIVRDGAVVGQGATRPAGQEHAEIVALADAGEAARGADLFVTLEPCAHFGRTPPCTHAIIAAGLKRVFIGVIDPNPLVHGKGIDQMREAGIEVEVGLLGERCARQLAPFFRFVQQRRPWVTLKAAVTLDGCVATASGHSKWITGEAARTDSHRLRARSDAVLVGSGTALADDPRLNVRHVPGEDPLRVVLDTHARLPTSAAMLGEGAIVLHGPAAPSSRLDALSATGADCVELPLGVDGRLDLDAAMTALRDRGVVNLMVEGGGQVHGALLRAKLADALHLYIAPTIIGRGRPAFDLRSFETIQDGVRLEHVSTEVLGEDIRLTGVLRYGDA